MELHGSAEYNLKLALESSKRLRGHPIHRDTLVFWSEILREARARRAAGHEPSGPELDRLIAELETVVVDAKVESNL